MLIKKIKLVALLALCTMYFLLPLNTVFGATTQSQTTTPPKDHQELKDNVDFLDKYITMNKDNLLTFDVEKAKKDGATSKQLELGIEFNQFSSDQNPKKPRGRAKPGLPVHGNWCGPGHGGDSWNNPKPKDNLDHRCMEHDLCYAKVGYFHCTCDRNLLWGIYKSFPYMKQGERGTASIVYVYFYKQMGIRFCSNRDMASTPLGNS
ncbi:hypothetical protein [Thermoactinomyces sp. DSM 45892]|uniref:hypothetical protein n=1 Tax=Thermoactinomyces sp. DSM 45892 TaxID=1882753 RepID=UPI0008962C33|nr:hypothetical protein [Thermoactinomyces sp. DSM 45892]SDZ25036.1 hypothetical protein SAMN05444416_11779 [Thermoactinomyces sp. DSM 45892]